MEFMYDPMCRATGDPFWHRRMEADLPSRQRLVALRSDLAAHQRPAAASRLSWRRRVICRLGDGMVSAGERLRAGYENGPPVAYAPSRPPSQ